MAFAASRSLLATKVQHSVKTPRLTRSYASVSASDIKFGQPVHETHPHILQPGECKPLLLQHKILKLITIVTPGITAQEYADRRAALAHSLSSNSIAVLHSAPFQYKSGAVFHPYRQESNFLWLTGWNEPNAVAVIEKTGPNLGDYRFCMFVKSKNPREEQWSGYVNGVQAAEDVFNADEAYSITQLDEIMPNIWGKANLVYTDVNNTKGMTDNYLWRFFSGAETRPAKTPLYPILNKLRVIKSPAEITNMRLAGQISGRVITEAMRRTWTKEKHLHAFLDYEFVRHGCDGPAYIPVVAGGERGNCIHYTVNNDVFKEGEFILIDAGGEYGTYITDISRTWPVNGKFTAAQRDLYQAVLNVQRTSVSLCRESANMSLEGIHEATTRGLITQLQAIGLDVSRNNIDQLFPHHVGHYIGLDVHDCPGYSRREPLKKGHCVTIEPGVYIPNDEKWPAHFRGVGVRIEDSVCVDDDSPYILSTEAVKEVDDIEALRP